MRFDANGGRAKNYEPNGFDGPRQTGEPLYPGFAVAGVTGSHAPVRHAEDDDFVQAGMLYRVMGADERARLVESIAASLGRVARADIVERSVAHFRNADPEYGARVEAAVKARR
jgi:catalase